MSIFDFNRDDEVSSSEQAFGLGAILAALSETCLLYTSPSPRD